MSTLEDAVHRIAREAPRRMVAQLIDGKLKAQGIELSEERLLRFIDALLSGQYQTFEQPGPSDQEVHLTITDEDQAELARRIDDFQNKQLPEIFDRVATGSAGDILRILTDRWPEESRQQTAEIAGFRARLSERWGLHARACQVTDEIICLLSGGFADGAMARWRTLHEISVVAEHMLRNDRPMQRPAENLRISAPLSTITDGKGCVLTTKT